MIDKSGKMEILNKKTVSGAKDGIENMKLYLEETMSEYDQDELGDQEELDKKLRNKIESLEKEIKILNKKVEENDNKENKELLDKLSKNLENLKGKLQNTINGQWSVAGQVRNTFMPEYLNPVYKIRKQIKSIEGALSLVKALYSQKELIEKTIRVSYSYNDDYDYLSSTLKNFDYTIKEEDKDLKTLLTNLTNEFVTQYINSELKQDKELTETDKKTIKNKVSKEINKDYGDIKMKLETEGLDYIKSYIKPIIEDIAKLDEIKEKIDLTKNSQLQLHNVSLVSNVGINKDNNTTIY